MVWPCPTKIDNDTDKEKFGKDIDGHNKNSPVEVQLM